MSVFDSIADNSLKSDELFYWRDLYKNSSSADFIDMWYEDPHYGRVDHEGSPVYLPEENVKQLISSNTSNAVFVANFVADAWEDFRKKIHEHAFGGVISKNSIYAMLEPQAGWQDINSFYHNWNAGMYEKFLSSFLQPSDAEKVTNFKEFINVYIQFLDRMSSSFPQTRESLLLSYWCSPMVSGLIVEVATASHADDALKATFFKDASYDNVVRTAREFGFKIDKNAPWRFIADLESNKMKEYMANYGLTNKEEMFDTLYRKSYNSELAMFKHYAWAWYSQYVKAKPIVYKAVTKECDNSSMSIIRSRERLTKEEAAEKFSDSFWVRLYIYIRARETNRPWKQPKFDRVVKEAANLMFLYDDGSGMKYIYREVEAGEKSKEHLKNNFTKEEIDVILRERNAKKHHGTFKL